MARCLVTMCAVALASTMARAQDTVPEPPAEQAGARAKAVEFNGDFNDPGNETAKQFARDAGVSVGEATRQLRQMVKAARLAKRLEEQSPDSFAGAEVSSGTRFGLKVFFKGSVDDARSKLAREAIDGELAGAVTADAAVRSKGEMRRLGREWADRLTRLGIENNVAVSAARDSLRLLVRDPAALDRLVAAGTVQLPDFIKVEQFSGIQTTASLAGGMAYNTSGGSNCTTGFVVQRASDYLRGITTAGHCDTPGRINTSFTSTYSSGGTTVSRQQRWISGDLDVQWSRSSGSDSYIPQFWNGSSYVTVTGGADDLPNTYVCKFGRTTRQTCGYIDAYEYSDSPTAISRG